jgi:hypothetical protein
VPVHGLQPVSEGQKLEDVAQRLLAKETLPGASDVDLDAYDRRSDQRLHASRWTLKSIRLNAEIGRHLPLYRRSFQTGNPFAEKQVNGVLARYHQDTAFLRRELIDTRLLARDKSGRDYWRVQD